ncbi:ion channel protein AlgE [Pseudomonas citronellolis]|uniref:ion channel protein AlgE n=1 Tax=Pseudomonas citronellolis TaxID=53408 RepID=UPI0023E3E51C|nr:ion channel protein AlgE [Pseudomonas citronellolis]MDF3932607.1 ion channel protein AlgE [Pseudomonas citronellolis]
MKDLKTVIGTLALLAPVLAQAADEGAFDSPADSHAAAPASLSQTTQAPVTSEFFNKLTMQGGFGPQDSVIGNGRESFYSLRYEPTFIWYSPEQRWAKWQVFGRAWINYDSSQATTGLQDNNQQADRSYERPEYFYSELRELYVRRNLIGDDPRFSASLGRQRFYDTYGIWWDDSIESLRLNYNDTFANGFVAVAQKFWNYNTDVNALDPRDKHTFYGMGEYALRWSGNNWVGTRFLYEDDRSDKDPDDPQDFTGWRAGLFFKGDDLDVTPVFSDYHLELAGLTGKVRSTDDNYVSSRDDTRGWMALGEIGKRFEALPWTPRVALRGGITDKPSDENDGFRLNRIESDRIINPDTYSTRLVSSFVRLDMRNLKYYGVALETRPTPRSSLDFRVSDLRMRDPDGDLPVRVDREQSRERNRARDAGTLSGGDSIGQVYDLNYYWKMFPQAWQGKHVDLNALVSASYLKAGSALQSGDDYQLSFGIVLRY